MEQPDKIRQAVAATAFPHGEKQPLGHVSISGGVAAFPRDGSSVAELLQHADEALYESKEGGRNQVRAYRGVDFGGSHELVVDPALVDAPERG
jgi:diguanylate cyclase (GGDEF)-like protein